VRSIKEECLDRLIPIGERHFRRAVTEYVEHYTKNGITKDSTIASSRAHWRSRRLIVYSDGVTETPAADDDRFGIDRLSRLAALERERRPDSFADTLMAALESFAGRKGLPHDDVTLVVIDIGMCQSDGGDRTSASRHPAELRERTSISPAMRSPASTAGP